MAYIFGEHWIRCTHCGAHIYRSDVVKDRTGLLACKKHVDPRQIGIDYPTIKLKQDPRPVAAGNIVWGTLGTVTSGGTGGGGTNGAASVAGSGNDGGPGFVYICCW